MASTYSPKLKFELIGAGEQAGLWGTTTNKNIGELIEQAIAGVTTVDLTGISGNYTLSSLDGTIDQARSAVVSCTGTATGATNIIIPTSTKLYVFRNASGYPITIKTAGQVGGVTLASGEANSVFCDGAIALAGLVTAGSGTTPVSGGGTGQTSFTPGFVVSPVPGGSTALTTVPYIALSSDVSGQLGVANGGTGVSTAPTSGSLLIGTSGGGYAVNQLTAGSGINITNSSGGITISQSSSSGVASFNGRTGTVTPIPSDYSAYYYSSSNPSGYITSSALSGYAALSGATFSGQIKAPYLVNSSESSGILQDGSIRIGNGSTTIFYLSNALVMAVNGTFNFSFNQNGNAYKPGGGVWADSSDARLKENVVPLTGALAKINSLNPVSFDWKYSRPNVPGVGFIAQEVQKVMPNAVQVSTPNEKQKPFIDDDQVLDVGWQNDMTAYLVAAIKELKAEVDSLKAQLGVK